MNVRGSKREFWFFLFSLRVQKKFNSCIIVVVFAVGICFDRRLEVKLLVTDVTVNSA